MFIESYPSPKPTEWTESNFRRLFREPPYLTLYLNNSDQYSFKVLAMEIDGKVVRYKVALLDSNNDHGSLWSFGPGSNQPLNNSLILLSVNPSRISAGIISQKNVFTDRISSYD